MTRAYYNENDAFAAQWLRNLIAAGHIAPGEVDDRGIEDVGSDDLVGFDQCHFFAGIGVWSYSLRIAGWPDDRPVWTGSCPCQPFSVAGSGAGMRDERHLWPVWFRFIEQRRPRVVFGEQVDAAIRHGWLDLVQADMEGIGYAFAPVGMPAAGVGAPHIRQRLWFVADDHQGGRAQFGVARLHADGQSRHDAAGCSADGRVADAGGAGVRDCGRGPNAGPARGVEVQGLQRQRVRHDAGHDDDGGPAQEPAASPTHGFWGSADWLLCRGGKWRPVSPLPQPLVDGSSESLGRVRPEVIAQIEKEINAATAQTQGGRSAAMRALLEALGAEAKRCWPSGGFPGLHEAPFLLAFLRQLQEQGWRIAQGVSLPCPQTTDGSLRGLRNIDAAGSAPCERSLDGQPTGEPADAVRVLSCLLARHASEAWGDAYAAHAETCFPLTHNARARVGRLRAYGNAIVPQVAAEVIRAYMECRP